MRQRNAEETRHLNTMDMLSTGYLACTHSASALGKSCLQNLVSALPEILVINQVRYAAACIEVQQADMVIIASLTCHICII